MGPSPSPAGYQAESKSAGGLPLHLGADGEEDEISVLEQGSIFGEQALFDQGLR